MKACLNTGEGGAVWIQRDSDNGRECVFASVDAGHNSTAVDLLQLVAWLKEHRPELISQPRAYLPMHTHDRIDKYDTTMPPGYRLLAVGEMIERTDIYWSDKWYTIGESMVLCPVEPGWRFARKDLSAPIDREWGAKKTHENFTITCDKCGSRVVIVESDLGFTPESGAMGSVDLICQDCQHRTAIIEW